MKKPIIHAYFLCYNEANILPHLLKYYLSFCEKVFIIDNHSTDNSRDIVESFKNTEFKTFDSGGEFNDHSNVVVKNNIWKGSRGIADYVILGDTDEFLYHEDMLNFLSDSFKDGISFFIPEGYHMVADKNFVLGSEDNIFELVKEGVRTEVLDKPMMFDCNKILEINYSYGAHFANPIGDVKIFKDNNLKMLHYKFLGLNDHMYKQKIRGERLSSFNKKYNMGTYYLFSIEEQKKDYEGYLNKRKKIL